MTSYLNLLSSYASAIDVFSQLKQDKRFMKFLGNFHKMEFADLVRKIVTNRLHMELDDKMLRFIEQEGDQVFTGKRAVEVFMGKLFVHSTKAINGLVIDVDFKSALPKILETFNKDLDITKEYTGTEVYNHMIDRVATDVVEKLESLGLDELSSHAVNGEELASIKDYVLDLMEEINDSVDFQPPSRKRKRDDDKKDNDDNKNKR